METRDIFEQMALRYDTEERMATAKVIAHEIGLALLDTQQKTALDYGCGTGLVGFQLLELFRQMLFVDTSPQMVAQVNRKIKEANMAGVAARCCDFMEEVPPEIKVDYVIVSQVLLHVKEYPLLLEKLYTVLNPGGHLLIVDFVKNEAVSSEMVHNGFVVENVEALCRNVGFSAASSKIFYHGEKIFMNQDASLFILDARK